MPDGRAAKGEPADVWATPEGVDEGAVLPLHQMVQVAGVLQGGESVNVYFAPENTPKSTPESTAKNECFQYCQDYSIFLARKYTPE